MKQWFALRTKPLTERRVATHLRRNNIEAFLPETPPATAGSARPAPFFPGYLFVNVDVTKTRSSAWLVPGAVYLVGYGDEPAPVPEEVIRLVRRQLELLAANKGRRARFQPGDPVRVTEGPFRDMVGIFDDGCSPGERVHVLLQALNRSLRLRLPVSALEKTAAPAPAGAKPARRTRGRGRPIRSPQTALS
jgi:transcriptional antiterminator RfaH